jgi:hypothetical protein
VGANVGALVAAAVESIIMKSNTVDHTNRPGRTDGFIVIRFTEWFILTIYTILALFSFKLM